MKRQPRYKPGDRIGDYWVFDVKMGGMGEVYLCLDQETGFPYALKTFQQRYLNKPKLRTTFENEVATWVALGKHPNVVRCYYMEIINNQPFMILEWIAGEESKVSDLRGRLRHGPLDLQSTMNIAIDIVRGLIHAQQRRPGLVHRDLKPENILIAQGALAKITDFGLAQIVQVAGLNIESQANESDSRQGLIGQGDITGTPAYMAPEQWRGEILDERTDIYAIGCILYEMLTGQWPFRVDIVPTTPQKHRQWLTAMQLAHETSPLNIRRFGLKTELGNLLEHCLNKEPFTRPSSLHDLLAQLERLYYQYFSQIPPVRPISDDFTATDYNNRAATYANLNRFDEALQDSNRAIEMDSTSVKSYSQRGAIYYELKRYTEALQDIDHALKLDSAYAPAYFNRASIYDDLQKYKDALRDYGQALKLYPKFVHAYSNRGLTYRHLGQNDEALWDFNRAIELDPNFAPAYSHRAVTYADLGRYDEALRDIEYAIELNPILAEAYSNRDIIHRQLERYDEALRDYDQALKLNPSLVDVYSSRAIAYANLGRYDEALRDFDQAIHLNPRYSEVYSNRGNLYTELQQYDEALRDFDQAIELDPTFMLAYFNRGNLYSNLRQDEKALSDYNRAIQLNPTYTLAYYNRGLVYVDLAQLDNALQDFDRATQLDPTYVEAYCNRGSVYSELQQYEAALKDFHRTIEIDPNYALAYFNLGLLFANTGQLRESLLYFEKATQLGLSLAAQTIVRVQQELERNPTSQPDLTDQAFAAFQKVRTIQAMRQTVNLFPFMTHVDFIVTIEQIIVHYVLPEHRPVFEQRLAWLRQIAEEQTQ